MKSHDLPCLIILLFDRLNFIEVELTRIGQIFPNVIHCLHFERFVAIFFFWLFTFKSCLFFYIFFSVYFLIFIAICCLKIWVQFDAFNACTSKGRLSSYVFFDPANSVISKDNSGWNWFQVEKMKMQWI